MLLRSRVVSLSHRGNASDRFYSAFNKETIKDKRSRAGDSRDCERAECKSASDHPDNKTRSMQDKAMKYYVGRASESTSRS